MVHRMHPGGLGIIAGAKKRAEPSREQLQSLVLSLSYYIQVLFNSGRCQNQSNTIQDGWPCRGFMELPPAYANILPMRCSTIWMAVRYFAKGISRGVYYFRPLHAKYLHYWVVSERMGNKAWYEHPFYDRMLHFKNLYDESDYPPFQELKRGQSLSGRLCNVKRKVKLVPCI